MQLKRIKEFNSETIDQDTAAEMCAILGLDSVFKSEQSREEGYTITNQWYGVSGKSCSQHADFLWDDPNYVDPHGVFERAHHGVTIRMNRVKGRDMRIYPDGRASCYIIYDEHSDWEHWAICTRDGHKHQDSGRFEYPYSPIKWVQLLIDRGFYTLTN